MKIGIDKIGFYAPNLYVDMADLAEARGVDPNKFIIGIGQSEMALPPITQDAVTLVANAARQILTEEDIDKIDLVIFGTESGIDHSKSGAVYVHRLLNLNPQARCIETKQACYSATAAIQLAKGHIALNPESKVLVLAGDIARYGLATPGESTQGAGGVAMLMSKEPRILALEEKSAYFTADIMDFWRPIYSDTAFVDGKFSNEQYIWFFNKVWEQYKEKTNETLADFAAICFHLPYTKMGLKALQTILEEVPEAKQEELTANYQLSTTYNRNVGNVYTGSLYLSLISLLEQQRGINAGSRIGLYSYGSGAVGEFFTGILQPNFEAYLNTTNHQEMFANRKQVTIEEYEEIFNQELPIDGSNVELDVSSDPAPICLAGIKENMRQYVNKLTK